MPRWMKVVNHGSPRHRCPAPAKVVLVPPGTIEDVVAAARSACRRDVQRASWSCSRLKVRALPASSSVLDGRRTGRSSMPHIELPRPPGIVVRLFLPAPGDGEAAEPTAESCCGPTHATRRRSARYRRRTVEAQRLHFCTNSHATFAALQLDEGGRDGRRIEIRTARISPKARRLTIRGKVRGG